MIFTITEGELQHYRFSGFVKPSGLKQGRFYRWITIILGEETENGFSTEELIGMDCLVYLSKRKDRYTVFPTDVGILYFKKRPLQKSLKKEFKS